MTKDNALRGLPVRSSSYSSYLIILKKKHTTARLHVHLLRINSGEHVLERLADKLERLAVLGEVVQNEHGRIVVRRLEMKEFTCTYNSVHTLRGRIEQIANERILLHLRVKTPFKSYAEVQRWSLREATNSHARKSAHLRKKDNVGDSIGSGNVDVILDTVRSIAMSWIQERIPSFGQMHRGMRSHDHSEVFDEILNGQSHGALSGDNTLGNLLLRLVLFLLSTSLLLCIREAKLLVNTLFFPL